MKRLTSFGMRHGCAYRAVGLLAAVTLVAFPARAADKCGDARDDIGRARVLATGGRPTEARAVLRTALFACPSDPQNLDLLAEVHDLLGDYLQAGKLRGQALRIRRVSAKPSVTFTADPPEIERGQTTSLSWNTTNATAIEIEPEPGPVAAKGTRTVAPGADTTYRLTARGPGGEITATVDIPVRLPRLTPEAVVDLLTSGVAAPRITKLAGERGLTFEMTPLLEEKFRAAGADDELLEALRKAPH